MIEKDLLTEMQVDYMPADKGARFANLIIDTIVFYALAFIIGILVGLVAPSLLLNESGTGASLTINLISFLLYFLYFTLFEGLAKGKTIGKFITKTRVVNEDGSAVTIKSAMLRTLSRFVPFEPFSALGGAPWHDKWTDTVVIKE